MFAFWRFIFTPGVSWSLGLACGLIALMGVPRIQAESPRFIQSTVTTGSSPVSVATGDFNKDGKLDPATANLGSGSVSVVLGNGTGGFGPKQDFPVSSEPLRVATGDFNGDGKLDLAVSYFVASFGTLSLLLGDGQGSFAPKVDVSDTFFAEALAVGDFNRDGKDDVAALALGVISVGLGPRPAPGVSSQRWWW